MPTPDEVINLIEGAGGKVDEVGLLPDGSGFATTSFPLRKDHWIYQETGDPPMPFRVGKTGTVLGGMTRNQLAELIRSVGKYAVKAATMSGKDQDFDPDAMLQNLVVGFLGYWTDDGLSHLD